MPSKKSKQQPRDAPAARPPAASAKKPARQDGDHEARPGAARVRGPELHLLAGELHPITFLDASFRWNRHRSRQTTQLLALIDSEEKQLRVIEDLYAIVKAQPKYKTLKEPNWKADTEPLQVINWLLRKLGPLAKGNAWTVDSYREGKKTKYQFVVWKDFDGNHFKHREELLFLDFLPDLVKRDRPLHDLIIDMVALVNKCNKVPLWDEDGEFSAEVDDLVTASKRRGSGERIVSQAGTYQGIAAEYLQLIRRRRRVVTAESVEAQLYEYRPTSERKRFMVWWLKSGLKCAAFKQCITKNSYVPNYVDGPAITPYEQYKFIWSCRSDDLVWKRAKSKRSKRDDKFGDFYPTMFSITRPGCKVKELQHDGYPVALYQFLSEGVKLIGWTYREYFMKETGLKVQVQTLTEIFANDIDNLLQTPIQIQV